MEYVNPKQKQIDNLVSVLSKYKHGQRKYKENAYNIPVTVIELNEQGAHEFNQILKLLIDLDLSQIIRTRSGGICTARTYNKYNCWDFRTTKICAELTVLLLEGTWRIQCRTSVAPDESGKALYGTTCLKKFKEICSKHNIDLDDYSVDNGLDIKAEWKKQGTIYKKYIYAPAHNMVDKTIENVHHIDLCSGFQSGLVRAYPEFYAPCKELYDKRKIDPAVKQIQVASIGAMWSDMNGAKYIKLAKAAIEENNRLLQDIIGRLVRSGRKPLLINTDGVWYQGDIYTDETEFADLGGWKTDHKNCKFRMKSSAAYEFIEDGCYHPVMSGQTNLDKIKPREEWTWGDIYNKQAVVLEYLITEQGICNKEGELL